MRHSQRGTAMVEAAITLIPFLVFLFAVLEAGWFFYVQATLTHAAREGAKISVRPLQGGTDALMSDNDVKAYVNAFLATIGTNCLSCIVVSTDLVNACTGCSTPRLTTRRHVRVTVPYHLLTLSMFSSLQFDMHGDSVMREETSTW